MRSVLLQKSYYFSSGYSYFGYGFFCLGQEGTFMIPASRRQMGA